MYTLTHLILLFCLAAQSLGYSCLPGPFQNEEDRVTFKDECIIDEQSVLCQGKSVTKLPDNLPNNITAFLIEDTSIRHLTNNMFASYPSICFLSISKNQLDKIEDGVFDGLPDLSQLELMSVGLNGTEKPKYFLNISNLEYLSLSGNNLGDIPIDQLHNLSKLVHLDMANNGINTIQDTSFPSLDKLEVIDIGENGIESLDHLSFSNIPNIKILQAYGNLMTNFDSTLVLKLKNLETIDLHNNAIANLNPSFCGNSTSLKSVQLGNNKLDSSIIAQSFANCSSIENLDISGNNMRSIDSKTFQGMSRLHTLSLAETSLESFPNAALDPAEALTHLDISYNNISQIDTESFRNLNGLTRLNMYNMKTNFSVEEGTFSKLLNLRTLYLDNNPGIKLSITDLQNLTKLDTVRLTYCELTTLDGNGFMNLPALEDLFIYGNPFKCDCHLSWMVEAVEAKKNWTSKWNVLGPVCQSPSHLMGRRIANFQPIDLTCSEPIVKPISPNRIVLLEGDDLEIEVSTFF